MSDAKSSPSSRLQSTDDAVAKVFSGEMRIEDLLASIEPHTPDEFLAALEPFARMHREGSDPNEHACVRGTSSDMTVITSGDFKRAFDLMPKQWRKEHREEFGA